MIKLPESSVDSGAGWMPGITLARWFVRLGEYAVAINATPPSVIAMLAAIRADRATTTRRTACGMVTSSSRRRRSNSWRFAETEIGRERGVYVGQRVAKLVRLLEERLRCDREVLGLVRDRVVPEQAVLAAGGARLVREECGLERLAPMP